VENYKIVVNDSANVVNLLNFIEETKKFFEIDGLQFGNIGQKEVYCKFTQAFADVVRLHEDVVSVEALL